MDDFLYGDFLMLDKELLYKEYLEFLKDNEEVDDILYYIAENNYEKFNSICLPSVQNIDDINKIYKTTRETDEETNISQKKQTIILKCITQFYLSMNRTKTKVFK